MGKRNSHPVEELELMAYLDGELPRERATAAAAHLEICRECQTITSDLRAMSQEMASWQIEHTDSQLSPQLLIALDEHLRAQENRPKLYRRNRRDVWRLSRVLGWSFAGAALVLLIFALSMPNLLRVQPVREQQTRERERIYDYYSSNGLPSPPEQTRSSGWVSASQNSLGQGTIGKLQKDEQAVHEVNIPSGPMIVRTAELSLTANDFEHARGRLEDILKRHNGYLGQLSVSGSADAAQVLTATLHVPAEQLDATIAELKALGRVESESQKGDEVSQQYVDLQARLANARTTEQTLIDILRHRTGKLSDVLAVEQEMTAVREEIERMQAEKKSLEKQVAFSTLNIKVAEEYKQQVHVVPHSTSGRIRNAAVEGYETMVAGLINLLLFLVSWGPSLLLWGAILFFPVRMLWRRWQARNRI